MTRGWERLSDRQRDKLLRALDVGDPDGECGAGILGKELLREMYAAKNLHAARWKLVAFYQHAVEADVPELTRLAKTVSAWETEILNYHVTGISNGPVEAQILWSGQMGVHHVVDEAWIVRRRRVLWRASPTSTMTVAG
jgi:hypothetical protein